MKRLSLIFLLVLASCATAAESPRPAPTLVAPDLRWWAGFADPQLDALLRETLAANPDLKIAAARLDVTQAALAGARSERRPSLNLGASAQRRAYTRRERAENPSLKNAATTLTLGPSASFEIDLWGRLARGVEAGSTEVLASAEDAAALQLALTGEVAAAWFALRANAEEQRLLVLRAAQARAALVILVARQSSGLADANPAEEQRRTLTLLDREASASMEEKSTLLHRLAALRGLHAADAPALAIPPLASAPANPLPATFTTAVLARRPDLRAATARLAAQQARVGEARAAALPSLALSAEGLFTGESLRELLRTGSLGGFIAAQIAAPLFDGGRRAARTESARAELTAAAETYAAIVVQVFQETADALARVEAARAEGAAAEVALRSAHRLADLAESRRAAGLTDRLTPLSAEAEMLTAATDLVRARLGEVHALIVLAKTLGGDWPAPASLIASVP